MAPARWRCTGSSTVDGSASSIRLTSPAWRARMADRCTGRRHRGMTLSRGRCPLCCGHLSTTKHSSEVPSDAPGEDHGPGARPARRPPAEDGLTRLQLTGIRDQLDNLLDEAARTNLSARETLALLCEREIARKDHRRIDMALKLAHFPARGSHELRLRRPALGRPQADPRSCGRQMDRQWRKSAPARSAGRRQDSSRHRPRPRGHPHRLRRAVRYRHDARGLTRQGARRTTLG
jgi:hypothetical protein